MFSVVSVCLDPFPPHPSSKDLPPPRQALPLVSAQDQTAKFPYLALRGWCDFDRKDFFLLMVLLVYVLCQYLYHWILSLHHWKSIRLKNISLEKYTLKEILPSLVKPSRQQQELRAYRHALLLINPSLNRSINLLYHNLRRHICENQDTIKVNNCRCWHIVNPHEERDSWMN